MTIDDKARNGKLQCDINREVAKISALSSSKTDKSGYLTSREILKAIENQGRQQAKAIKNHLI